MTTLLDFGSASLNVPAACQQLCILGGIYNKDRANVESLIGSQGEILVWFETADTWPPGLAVVKSGGNRYFVCLEGTTNIGQGAIHALGSWMRKNYAPGCDVNGAWGDAANKVVDIIFSRLPPDIPPGDLYWSGHSYGAAIAFILACVWAEAHKMDTGKVLTFGEPRSFFGVTPPFGPTVHWRVCSQKDVVQQLPFDSNLPLAAQWATPLDWDYADPVWVHGGFLRTLYAGGTINDPEPNPDPLPYGVVDSPIEEHLLRNYWGRLNQWNLRFGT